MRNDASFAFRLERQSHSLRESCTAGPKAKILRQMLALPRYYNHTVPVLELYCNEKMQGETEVIIGEFKVAFWPGGRATRFRGVGHRLTMCVGLDCDHHVGLQVGVGGRIGGWHCWTQFQEKEWSEYAFGRQRFVLKYC
jgi:hypothetical protein